MEQLDDLSCKLLNTMKECRVKLTRIKNPEAFRQPSIALKRDLILSPSECRIILSQDEIIKIMRNMKYKCKAG